jgi:hypothetical protein
MKTRSNPLREFRATYDDGYEFVLYARDMCTAVLSAQEMHLTRLTQIVPIGEW